MKVYMFSEHYASRQAKHSGNHHGAKQEKRKFVVGSNAMEDVIEISPEAMEHFEQEKIKNLSRERIKKSIREYYPIIKEYVDLADGDLRKLYRPENVLEIKNSLYDYGNKKALAETAEKISLLLNNVS